MKKIFIAKFNMYIFLLVVIIILNGCKTQKQNIDLFEKVKIDFSIISKNYITQQLMLSEINNMSMNIANLIINGYKFEIDGNNIKLYADNTLSYDKYQIINETNKIVNNGNKYYLIKDGTMMCERNKLKVVNKTIQIKSTSQELFSSLLIEFIKKNTQKSSKGTIYLTDNINLNYQSGEASGGFAIILNGQK